MLVIPIITPFIDPTIIWETGLSWKGSLNFIFKRNKAELMIKIVAINKIIKFELSGKLLSYKIFLQNLDRQIF